MIKAKHAGKPIPKLAEAKPSNVINLMDALKRSVKAEQGGAKSSACTPRAGARARARAHRANAPPIIEPRQAGGLRSQSRWRRCGPIDAKRDFGKTAEPRGKAGRKKGFGYVIQKHDATRLHYDLRLELDGVMLSWAVTRGPSLVPGDKRLAIHVEDHPIEYNKFEGTIPKANTAAAP